MTRSRTIWTNFLCACVAATTLSACGARAASHAAVTTSPAKMVASSEPSPGQPITGPAAAPWPSSVPEAKFRTLRSFSAPNPSASWRFEPDGITPAGDLYGRWMSDTDPASFDGDWMRESPATASAEPDAPVVRVRWTSDSRANQILSTAATSSWRVWTTGFWTDQYLNAPPDRLYVSHSSGEDATVVARAHPHVTDAKALRRFGPYGPMAIVNDRVWFEGRYGARGKPKHSGLFSVPLNGSSPARLDVEDAQNPHGSSGSVVYETLVGKKVTGISKLDVDTGRTSTLSTPDPANPSCGWDWGEGVLAVCSQAGRQRVVQVSGAGVNGTISQAVPGKGMLYMHVTDRLLAFNRNPHGTARGYVMSLSNGSLARMSSATLEDAENGDALIVTWHGTKNRTVKLVRLTQP